MDNINDIQYFVKENQFEQALVDLLPHHGWEKEVLVQPTEEDLIHNWAKILFDNNRDINKLGNYPLTASEMRQILDQVNLCDSPYAMNMFINGGQVCIKRDNPADTNNYGKEVYLKIFDAREISAGQSRYQIARQPRFKASHPLGGDRRGDVMLLINGMPVIHIELKRSKVDVSQATFQIKRHTHEGVFGNGIFKMVQIFVAMTPEETLYFANPGKEENFKPEFYFHWEDFNNTVIRDWRRIVSDLLSIPMAHQLIGYYTIADDKDKTLKVLRSYQYFAASKISDITHKTNWDTHQHRGGYVWHTTGSGKTMTSFKSAQLIANSGDADKVVFLLDRIELSVQSLDEYRGFAGEDEAIQDTQNTAILLSKLKSTDNDATDKSAKVILKYWDRKYKRTADLVVIEGPQAGGHLGFHKDELEKYTEESYSEEIKKIIATVESYAEKYQTEVPVIVAGGICDKEDVQKVAALGVDGVQVATRFITTEECDADIRYKEAHLNARKEDIAIVKSPVGMPGRAIMNKFMKRVMSGEQISHSPCHGCLVKCSPKEIPYCITDGLINAVKGNVDDGLLFCGAKAWKADRLETVQEVISELF